MTNEQILKSLAEHAHGTEHADGRGLADSLWQLRASGRVVDYPEIWESISALLSEFSAARCQDDESSWISGVAYAVSEMLSVLARTALELGSVGREEIGTLLWHVAEGWCAALAGDVTDIAEYVRLEAVARGLPAL